MRETLRLAPKWPELAHYEVVSGRAESVGIVNDEGVPSSWSELCGGPGEVPLERRRGLVYHTVDEIVCRTRGTVGFHFTPHQLRHTYATVARRGGVPVEIVSKLLCHRSVQTTSDIYLHASPENLRAELERAGVLERLEALT